MSPDPETTTVTAREAEQVAAANATGRQPVVFIHGLWLLHEQLGRLARRCSRRRATRPSRWTGPTTQRRTRRRTPTPRSSPKKSVGQVADHVADVIAGLDRKPVVIGHSFGGLLAQIIAGRGLAIASVEHRPGPQPRGAAAAVHARSRPSFPVLGNPANRGKAVTLTFDQFRYGFANAVQRGGGAHSLRDLPRARHRAGRSSRRPRPTSTRPPRPRRTRRNPDARGDVDRLRRGGPHRPVAARQRGLQAAAEEHQPHRDRRDPRASVTRW